MAQIKPNIVEEQMDGELLAIDDTSGTYVAVGGSGVWLWGLLRDGVDHELIKAAVDPSAHAEIDDFLAGLHAAGLMIDGGPASPLEPPEAPERWTAPRLEVHDDLQDLLLLDPIHEVTDAGWPNTGTPG